MEQFCANSYHQVRHRLGIPDDAERVLIFSASLPVLGAIAEAPSSLTWKREDGRIQMESLQYHIELDEFAGGIWKESARASQHRVISYSSFCNRIVFKKSRDDESDQALLFFRHVRELFLTALKVM